jgi:hypothetical protein
VPSLLFKRWLKLGVNLSESPYSSTRFPTGSEEGMRLRRQGEREENVKGKGGTKVKVNGKGDAPSAPRAKRRQSQRFEDGQNPLVN